MLRKTAITWICLLLVPAALVGRQEPVPSPPADHSLIYVLDAERKLAPLPFEHVTTPLPTTGLAKTTKTSYIELKGEHAATVLPANSSIFVFAIDRGGAHPPMIVWLTPHRGARRVTAIAERGRGGFAIG